MRKSLILGATLALTGCASDSLNLPDGSGVLRVQLTDAPFPTDSVESVDIWVVRIDAKHAEGDSAEAAAAVTDDSVSAGGWTTIARPDRSFDLLTLRNGAVAEVGEAVLPEGNYRGFRLVIDPSKSSLTLKGGMVLDGQSSPSITFPSAARSGIKVRVEESIPVGEDSTSTVLVDFDLENSFVMRGNSIAQNGLLFKPVVKASRKTTS